MLLQGTPGHEGHCEIWLTTLLTVVPQRQDVRMGESDRVLRLSLEADEKIWIGREHGGEQLDRCLPPRQAPVPRVPDLVHSTAPEWGYKLVRSEDPYHFRQCRLPALCTPPHVISAYVTLVTNLRLVRRWRRTLLPGHESVAVGTHERRPHCTGVRGD